MSNLAMPVQAHQESNLILEWTSELIDELIKLVKANNVEGVHSWSPVANTPAAKLPRNIDNVLTVLLKSKLLKSFFTLQELELLTEIKDCMKNPNTSSGYDLNDQITQKISRIQGINAEQFKQHSLAFVQYYREHVSSKLSTELERNGYHDVVMNIITSFLTIIGHYANQK